MLNQVFLLKIGIGEGVKLYPGGTHPDNPKVLYKLGHGTNCFRPINNTNTTEKLKV